MSHDIGKATLNNKRWEDWIVFSYSPHSQRENFLLRCRSVRTASAEGKKRENRKMSFNSKFDKVHKRICHKLAYSLVEFIFGNYRCFPKQKKANVCFLLRLVLSWKHKLDEKSSTNSHCCDPRTFDCCLLSFKTPFVSSLKTVKKGQLFSSLIKQPDKQLSFLLHFPFVLQVICLQVDYFVWTFGWTQNTNTKQHTQVTTQRHENDDIPLCLHSVKTTWIWERWKLNRMRYIAWNNEKDERRTQVDNISGIRRPGKIEPS